MRYRPCMKCKICASLGDVWGTVFRMLGRETCTNRAEEILTVATDVLETDLNGASGARQNIAGLRNGILEHSINVDLSAGSIVTAGNVRPGIIRDDGP